VQEGRKSFYEGTARSSIKKGAEIPRKTSGRVSFLCSSRDANKERENPRASNRLRRGEDRRARREGILREYSYNGKRIHLHSIQKGKGRADGGSKALER